MSYAPRYYHRVTHPLIASDELHEYRLFAYGKDGEQRMLNAQPVLFIPGSSASYKQMRSIASVTQRASSRIQWYGVDYRSEASALSGILLQREVGYAAKCLKVLLHLHPQSEIIIVAHSLGGIVARMLLTLDGIQERVRALMTLGAPQSEFPVFVDHEMHSLYIQVNRWWRSESRVWHGVNVVSISGGERDSVVESHLSSFIEHKSVLTRSIPFVEMPVDHLCLLWCRELVVQMPHLLNVMMNMSNSRRMHQVSVVHDAQTWFRDQWLLDTNNNNDRNIDTQRVFVPERFENEALVKHTTRLPPELRARHHDTLIVSCVDAVISAVSLCDGDDKALLDITPHVKFAHFLAQPTVDSYHNFHGQYRRGYDDHRRVRSVGIWTVVNRTHTLMRDEDVNVCVSTRGSGGGVWLRSTRSVVLGATTRSGDLIGREFTINNNNNDEEPLWFSPPVHIRSGEEISLFFNVSVVDTTHSTECNRGLPLVYVMSNSSTTHEDVWLSTGVTNVHFGRQTRDRHLRMLVVPTSTSCSVTLQVNTNALASLLTSTFHHIEAAPRTLFVTMYFLMAISFFLERTPAWFVPVFMIFMAQLPLRSDSGMPPQPLLLICWCGFWMGSVFVCDMIVHHIMLVVSRFFAHVDARVGLWCVTNGWWLICVGVAIPVVNGSAALCMLYFGIVGFLACCYRVDSRLYLPYALLFLFHYGCAFLCLCGSVGVIVSPASHTSVSVSTFLRAIVLRGPATKVQYWSVVCTSVAYGLMVLLELPHLSNVWLGSIYLGGAVIQATCAGQHALVVFPTINLIVSLLIIITIVGHTVHNRKFKTA